MAIEQQPKEFEEKVIAIDRVARVVRGGRRFRFRATVVVGDGKGRVGVGVGKGSEVMTSNVVEVAGIRDLLTKSLGSSNKVNNAYATALALSRLRATPVKEKAKDKREKVTA